MLTSRNMVGRLPLWHPVVRLSVARDGKDGVPKAVGLFRPVQTTLGWRVISDHSESVHMQSRHEFVYGSAVKSEEFRTQG